MIDSESYVILQELYDDAVDILEIVASYIRLCQTLKHDNVYESVMETIEHAMDINRQKKL